MEELYSYKLNNSYTTYVNYDYLRECIKVCEGKHGHMQNKGKTSVKQDVIVPLFLGDYIRHKTLGIGKLIAKEPSGIITIEFCAKTVRFMYPIAFKVGQLAKI